MSLSLETSPSSSGPSEHTVPPQAQALLITAAGPCGSVGVGRQAPLPQWAAAAGADLHCAAAPFRLLFVRRPSTAGTRPPPPLVPYHRCYGCLGVCCLHVLFAAQSGAVPCRKSAVPPLCCDAAGPLGLSASLLGVGGIKLVPPKLGGALAPFNFGSACGHAVA